MFFLIQNQMINTSGTFKGVFWLGKESVRGYIKILYHLLRWQEKKKVIFKKI